MKKNTFVCAAIVGLFVLSLGTSAWAGPLGLFSPGAMSHEVSVKEIQIPSMSMNVASVAQAVGHRGQVVVSGTLIGESDNPAMQRIETEQVPVQVAGTPASPPQMPANLQDAKLRWCPPPQDQCPPTTVMKTVIKTVTIKEGAKVLATFNAGGNTTGHDILQGLAYSVPAATGYATGQAARRPNTTSNNVQGGNANQQQGQVSRNTNLNANKNTNPIKVDVDANAISGSASDATAITGGKGR